MIPSSTAASVKRLAPMVNGPTSASTCLVTAYELLQNSAAATTEQIAKILVLGSSTPDTPSHPTFSSPPDRIVEKRIMNGTTASKLAISPGIWHAGRTKFGYLQVRRNMDELDS